LTKGPSGKGPNGHPVESRPGGERGNKRGNSEGTQN